MKSNQIIQEFLQRDTDKLADYSRIFTARHR